MDMPHPHKDGHIEMDPAYYAAEVCDISFNEENFYVNMTSGRRGRIYVLTPKHAKRLYLLLKKDLEEYEKKFGELRTGIQKKKPHTTASERRSMGFSH